MVRSKKDRYFIGADLSVKIQNRGGAITFGRSLRSEYVTMLKFCRILPFCKF
jgi:hypothetical protein